MNNGLSALTEKERQALRLLASGHDAKSIARHLGLSVHTIHERLRDARRKLATSSSREAARLLHDLESAAPEKSVDMVLGEAPASQSIHPAAHQPIGRTTWPLTGWITGGIAMSLALAILAVAALSAPEAAPPATPAAATTESAPVIAARQFLALIDTNNWAASWDATGKSFKALNTSAIWAKASTQVREQFGLFKSRQLISADYAPAPPEGYWVVKFRANYANKASAIETLSLERENNEWRVVGVTVE